MIEFISLRTIITDLLKIIRGSKISQSEPISERQVEGWVHEYRALLLKRDIDKGKMPNPDYIQEINGLVLTEEDVIGSDMTGLTSNIYVFKTSLTIPNTIDFNHKSGIVYIGTLDGKEFQLVPQGRSSYQQYKKYTNNDTIAYLKNGYLYLLDSTPLKYINIRGIFEIPTKVSNFVNTVTTAVSSDLDDRYPIPANMLPVLKEMILKQELGIESKSPSDDKNDSQSKVEPQIKEEV